MTRSVAASNPGARPKPFSFDQSLKEISMFFEGRDEVHKTMRRLVKRLESKSIPYAIMGGLAVNAHKYRRREKTRKRI